MDGKQDKYFAFFIALLPILNIYGLGVPGISIGKLIIVFIIIWGIILRKYDLPSFPKLFLLYFLYILIVPQLFTLITGEAKLGSIIYKSIGSLFFLFILGYGCKYLNFKYLIRYYELIVIVCCAFFFVQELAFDLFNLKIIGIISWLPLTNMDSTIEHISRMNEFSRSSSFFLEPSHFVQFISIFLVMKVFSKRKNFVDFSSVFISLILVFAQSGIGYLALLLVWVSFFVFCLYRRKHVLAIVLTLVIMGGLSMPIGNRLGVFSGEKDSPLSRISELSSREVEYTSGYIRIYRGYVFYSGLTPVEKIVGIGLGSLETYLEYQPMPKYEELLFSTKDDYYLNGIQQHLVFGGIIGLFLYLLFLFKLLRHNSIIGKIVVLLIILLGFVTMTFNDVIILLMLIFAFLFKVQNVENKQITEEIKTDIQ